MNLRREKARLSSCGDAKGGQGGGAVHRPSHSVADNEGEVMSELVTRWDMPCRGFGDFDFRGMVKVDGLLTD